MQGGLTIAGAGERAAAATLASKGVDTILALMWMHEDEKDIQLLACVAMATLLRHCTWMQPSPSPHSLPPAALAITRVWECRGSNLTPPRAQQMA